MRTVALALFLALPAFAVGATAPAPAPAAPAASDGATAYQINAGEPLKVKRGQVGTARFAVIPRADAHVSPDAPISLTVTSGAGLKLSKAKFGRTDAKETAAKGVEFAVPFTAETAGKEEVKGTLSFFICTEKLCEKQKRDISLAVLVE